MASLCEMQNLLCLAALPELKDAVIELLLTRDAFGFHQNQGGLELQARSKCGSVESDLPTTHGPLHGVCHLIFGI